MQRGGVGDAQGGSDQRSIFLRLWHKIISRTIAWLTTTMPNPQGAWDAAEWTVTRWQDDFELGDHSYFNSTPRLHRYPNTEGQKVHVGKFCSMGKDIEFLLGGDHRVDWVTTYPLLAAFGDEGHQRDMTTRGEITIGNDVWIGRGALIRSGVAIGTGAVIGTRAVVTRDVRPYAVVAGNPAREVRRRFDDQTIARLLASEWWDLPLDTIKAGMNLLSSSDIETFLNWIDSLAGRTRDPVDLRERATEPPRAATS